jgi:hypothetical protein
LPYLKSGQGKICIFCENILHNLGFLKIFCKKLFFINFFFCKKEKVRKKKDFFFFASRDSKTARIHQTKTKPYKIGQIRQKSARNWESARNKIFPPDDFQIRQNYQNLAEKTAI